MKENKEREVFLSGEALRILKVLLDYRENDLSDSSFIFLNPNARDGKLHLGSVDQYMRKVIHKEVLGYGEEREPRSPHDCRRTYASLEYLNGTDIYTLSRQMGHSKITQTEDYIKDVVDAAERRSKLKGCGLLLEEPSKINVYDMYTTNKNKKRAL